MSLPDSRDGARAHDGSGGSDERHAEYERRLGERRAALTVEDQRHFKIGNLRIAVFLFTVAMFFAAFIGQSFSGWWLLLPVAVLIVIGRQLERAEARIARLQRAVAFYDRGLARLEHRWIGAGDDGAEFGDSDHLYATDLDVLGGGSLFQLLSVAQTERGLETLAAWLLTPAPIDTIAARQQSVRELAARLDLREEMAVSGSRSTERGSADALVAWGARPSQHVTSSSRAGAGLLSALGLGAVVAGVTALFANFGIIVIAQSTADSLEAYFFVVAAACFAIHGVARRWTEPILADVFRAERDLGLLADVLASLERSTFTSPYLMTLRQTLVTTGLPASARIARLKLYAALVAARRN
ncbi:MAG TPA: hypothetical protein VJP86_16810, partial [Vicinamibacterales bacterium]|nr:hypothetical protein [Vicinamibacterales bacterium]